MSDTLSLQQPTIDFNTVPVFLHIRTYTHHTHKMYVSCVFWFPFTPVDVIRNTKMLKIVLGPIYKFQIDQVHPQLLT